MIIPFLSHVPDTYASLTLPKVGLVVAIAARLAQFVAAAEGVSDEVLKALQKLGVYPSLVPLAAMMQYTPPRAVNDTPISKQCSASAVRCATLLHSVLFTAVVPAPLAKDVAKDIGLQLMEDSRLLGEHYDGLRALADALERQGEMAPADIAARITWVSGYPAGTLPNVAVVAGGLRTFARAVPAHPTQRSREDTILPDYAIMGVVSHCRTCPNHLCGKSSSTNDKFFILSLDLPAHSAYDSSTLNPDEVSPVPLPFVSHATHDSICDPETWDLSHATPEKWDLSSCKSPERPAAVTKVASSVVPLFLPRHQEMGPIYLMAKTDIELRAELRGLVEHHGITVPDVVDLKQNPIWSNYLSIQACEEVEIFLFIAMLERGARRNPQSHLIDQQCIVYDLEISESAEDCQSFTWIIQLTNAARYHGWLECMTKSFPKKLFDDEKVELNFMCAYLRAQGLVINVPEGWEVPEQGANRGKHGYPTQSARTQFLARSGCS